MKYVALLRGINVGGHTKVEMPKLKQTFERIGCTEVITYINSGNVVFADDREAAELTSAIELAITQDFELNIRIVLRQRENIALLCQKIPADWTNDSEQKTDVMFLWDEVDNSDIMKKIDVNPKIENALYLPGALVWNIGRDNVARGGGIKLIKTDIYRHMTIRNINTVRKLYQLMKLEP